MQVAIKDTCIFVVLLINMCYNTLNIAQCKYFNSIYCG